MNRRGFLKGALTLVPTALVAKLPERWLTQEPLIGELPALDSAIEEEWQTGSAYTVGDNVRFDVNYREMWTDIAIEPAMITLKIKSPRLDVPAAVYTYPQSSKIVRDGLGCYHAGHVLNYPGTWHIRWEVNNSVVCANECSIDVR